MSEELIVAFASPTPAGIKTGSLFSGECGGKEELSEFAARMNREFCVDISAQTYKANCRPVALTKLPLLVTEPMVGKLIAWMEQCLSEMEG